MNVRLMIIAFVLASLTGAGAAWACSCILPESAVAQFDRSDLIFVGRAVRTVAEAGQPAHAERKVTRFEVVRTLKGGARQVRRIAHPGGSSAGCGISFRAGETYLVLAEAYQGRLATSLCQQPFFERAEYDRIAERRAAAP